MTGQVLAVRQHPNADRLRLCTVDHGGGEPQEVVCGAPNVAEGQMICFAPEGLTLPNGVKLKKAKIRGIESRGMICAADELGLGEDHTGIIVLSRGHADRRSPSPRCWGCTTTSSRSRTPTSRTVPISGATSASPASSARSWRRRSTPPGTPLADAALEAAEGEPFPIDIEDPEGCRRYLGIVIENITNRPSPPAIRYRLEALGMRSIDLLVDLTNLVMLEQGQPLHAFDLRDPRGRAASWCAGPAPARR